MKTNFILDAPEVATRFVQRRIYDTAARVEGGADAFWSVFSEFKAAVDALPDLQPLLRVGQELRSIPLSAYVMAGVKVPREIWDALMVGQFYEEPRGGK